VWEFRQAHGGPQFAPEVALMAPQSQYNLHMRLLIVEDDHELREASPPCCFNRRQKLDAHATAAWRSTRS